MILRPSISSALFAATGLLLFAGSAPAALTGATGCLEAKHKAVGRHVACVLKGRLAEVAKGTPFDPSSCDADLGAAFTAAETAFAPACRTSGDSALLSSRSLDLSAALDVVLDPGAAAPGAEASCVQAKLKSAAKRAACGAKAKSIALKKDLLDRDVTKCEAKLVAAFAKIEAGGGCPAGGSADDARVAVEGAFGEAEADLANLGTADYAKKGRYVVATRTMTFVDGTRPTKANGSFPGAPERTIPVTVWYPAVSTAANAAFADAAAPFPLVLRAHGFGAFRNDSADLAKHLASRGMIVVSPDFPLSNINAPGGATLSDLDQQVVDVSFVIDRMLALAATPGDPFEGRVDASRVAAIGHSLGGATVLGTGYHPTLHDARLKAVIALAPLACLYQEAFFDGGDAPLMILSGTADLVTIPASNHVAPFGFANPEKYLVSLDGGLHIGFADDFLRNDSVNADEALACPALLPPGTPRPVSIPFALPPDFLGGAAAGVDVTGSACEPICPLPSGTWMAHARQRDLELASCAAMLGKVFRGDVSADRLLTGRLDTDNDDVTLAFER